jgi:hypothetical protein
MAIEGVVDPGAVGYELPGTYIHFDILLIH